MTEWLELRTQPLPVRLEGEARARLGSDGRGARTRHKSLPSEETKDRGPGQEGASHG